jgi:hypothetical protein
MTRKKCWRSTLSASRRLRRQPQASFDAELGTLTMSPRVRPRFSSRPSLQFANRPRSDRCFIAPTMANASCRIATDSEAYAPSAVSATLPVLCLDGRCSGMALHSQQSFSMPNNLRPCSVSSYT